MTERFAQRYAQALMDLALEKKIEEKVYQDMVVIIESIDESSDFSALLKSPIVKEDKKHAIVEAIFKGKITKETLSFLQLLIKKHREAALKSVAQSYIKLFKKYKNILVAELISSSPLNDKTKKSLIEKVKTIHNGDIEIKESIDSDLMGGFILRIDGKQYDASIASKLRKIRKELIYN